MPHQCISRRIDDMNRLHIELATWEFKHNTLVEKGNWYFRTSDARIKLSLLYPTFATASD